MPDLTWDKQSHIIAEGGMHMEKKYGIQLKWLSVTCFEITDGNITIVSDPCVTESPLCPLTWEDIEKCDYRRKECGRRCNEIINKFKSHLFSFLRCTALL